MVIDIGHQMNVSLINTRIISDIFVGNGIGESRSNPGRNCLNFSTLIPLGKLCIQLFPFQ